MERRQTELGHAEQKAAIAPLVDEVFANGVFEIAASNVVDMATA